MKNLFFVFLLSVLILSCKKDTDITDITQSGPFPIVNVESSLSGIVTNETGAPLSGATVTVAGQKYTTNKYGLFFVHKRLLNKNGEWVKASLNGYVTSGKFAYQNLNNSNFIKIPLISKFTNLKVISSLTGGVVDVNGGGKIEFPENAFITTSGQPYSGQVYIYHRKLSPADQSTYNIMPGNLRAADKDGNARILKTFGMLNVDLLDQSGNTLQLAPGKTAKISLTLPPGILGIAPNKIPLWHFDNETGLWKEEGEGILENGTYVGNVTHFSFWNYDVPSNYIKLSGCISDQNGKPVQGLSVYVSSTNFGTGYASTDDKGLFGGYVPNNDDLTIKIYDQCNTLLYIKDLGTLNTDTDLGKIIVNISDPIKITGKLLDCSGNALATGLVTLQDDSSTVAQVQSKADGSFEFVLNNCSKKNALKLTAYNYSDPLQSNPITVQINSSDINIGDIIVCSSLNEYLQVITGTSNYIYSVVNFTSQQNIYYLNGTTGNYGMYISMSSINNNIGEMTYIEGGYPENGVFKSLFCNFCPNTSCGCDPNDKMIFTNFSTTGDYSIGSFSGIVKSDSTGIGQPVTINFKAKLK